MRKDWHRLGETDNLGGNHLDGHLLSPFLVAEKDGDKKLSQMCRYRTADHTIAGGVRG